MMSNKTLAFFCIANFLLVLAVATTFGTASLVDGKVPTSELGSGSASSSTYLRGDQSWATPAGSGDAFPVGAVYLSIDSTNPGTTLGYGTWSAIASGKALVGLDSGDTDFDTVEETGGAKTVQSSAQTFAGDASTVIVNHIHTQAAGTTTTGNFTQVTTAVDTSSGGTGATPTQTALHTRTGNPVAGGAASYTPTGTNTPGSATSVVQPYFVVYVWKRTA